MQRGRIKTLKQGFGFITPDDGSQDVFFHFSDVDEGERQLQEGASVEYEVIQGEKGPRALAVVVKGPKQEAGHGESGQRPQRTSGQQNRATSSLPAQSVLPTFYCQGALRREIYIESAKATATAFGSQQVTRTSIRRLFFMLKSATNQIQGDEEKDLPFVRQRLYEFHRLVVYNNKRLSGKTPLLPTIVKEWVDAHLDLAESSVAEFVGFVEYLTSVVAYLRDK
jgi:CspA family cold shock protein